MGSYDNPRDLAEARYNGPIPAPVRQTLSPAGTGGTRAALMVSLARILRRSLTHLPLRDHDVSLGNQIHTLLRNRA